jgi:hypothetical protein
MMEAVSQFQSFSTGIHCATFQKTASHLQEISCSKNMEYHGDISIYQAENSIRAELLTKSLLTVDEDSNGVGGSSGRTKRVAIQIYNMGEY